MAAFAAALVAALMVGVIVAAECLGYLWREASSQKPVASSHARGVRGHGSGVRSSALIKTFCALCVLCGSLGCRTISYSDATGRTFSHSNFAFDTKVGRISVRKTADGEEVTIENLDSQSQALQLAREAIQAVRP
jgi:hypothetical protein